MLGVIVLATILTIMYYRLTTPEAGATPSPTAGTPQALEAGPSLVAYPGGALSAWSPA